MGAGLLLFIGFLAFALASMLAPPIVLLTGIIAVLKFDRIVMLGWDFFLRVFLAFLLARILASSSLSFTFGFTIKLDLARR